MFLPSWVQDEIPSIKSKWDEDRDALEEERRIAFVGLTRAKTKVYISCSKMFQIQFNSSLPKEPSLFVKELKLKERN